MSISGVQEVKPRPSNALERAGNVHDPRNYQLRASLYKNNFATFYSYDAEGRLYLVKKGTVRGNSDRGCETAFLHGSLPKRRSFKKRGVNSPY
jgi:hypothetical protein